MTNLTESNLFSGCFFGGVVVLALTFSTHPSLAENAAANSKSKQENISQRPERTRARLREDLTEYLIVEPERPNEADFEWSSLTHSGPGSGTDPIVGDRHVASYYEFNDGHQYPFFIAKPR